MITEARCQELVNQAASASHDLQSFLLVAIGSGIVLIMIGEKRFHASESKKKYYSYIDAAGKSLAITGLLAMAVLLSGIGVFGLSI